MSQPGIFVIFSNNFDRFSLENPYFLLTFTQNLVLKSQIRFSWGFDGTISQKGRRHKMGNNRVVSNLNKSPTHAFRAYRNGHTNNAHD
jgi:hypothetical protein